MADFYTQWLGIPEGARPPAAHQLLGIAMIESNPVAVIAAAERQLERVREFQTGPQAADSQRISAEITKARDTVLETLAQKARAEAAIPEAIYTSANDAQKSNWWNDWKGANGEIATGPEVGMALPPTEPAPPVREAQPIEPSAEVIPPDSAVHRDWRTEPPPAPASAPSPSQSAPHVEGATPDEPNPAPVQRRGSQTKSVVLFLIFYALPVTLFVVFAVQLWETQKVPAIVCMSGALFSTIFGVLHLLMTGRQ